MDFTWPHFGAHVNELQQFGPNRVSYEYLTYFPNPAGIHCKVQKIFSSPQSISSLQSTNRGHKQLTT